MHKYKKIQLIFYCLFFSSFLSLSFSCKDSLNPYFPELPGEEEPTEPTEPIDPSENIYDNYVWVSKIRKDHPRVFFNKESFLKVKALALGDERTTFDRVKSRVDELLGKDIVFTDPLIVDGNVSINHTYGTRAAEAAFVYLVTEDQNYFTLARNLLEKIVGYYELRNDNKLNVAWHAFSRIHTIMAYDWLFNSLSESDKQSIGTKLFKAIKYMLPAENRSDFVKENRKGIDGGFYGNQVLEWYLGLVFHGTGIDDENALDIMKTGYESHRKVFEYRTNASGDDGGSASGTLPYCLPDYPWAEYNFFHSFISATGYNVTTRYDYQANFVNYLYWNTLPQKREFGYGDAHHVDNSIDFSVLNLHLSQLIYFYGDRFPQHAAVAKWIMNTIYTRPDNESTSFPLTRFYLTDGYEPSGQLDLTDKMPKARYFENMGQFFMRSGSGADDTYATFTVGSTLSNHRHYDNNNFLIYKKGFLCLDAGTRPQPGLHLSHYYARTVAHNCITIRMPGEVLPDYWGGGDLAPGEVATPVPNDGGQNNLKGTEVVGFDEKEHYVYIASDATKSYSSSKASLVMRQFVFLLPNNFIVFDRVNSTNADYPKKWLLHTAYKPVISGENEFHASQEQGRLICKTIYPENASSELIGGPGKQFWSDGRNWALPNGGDNNPLYGQWRVEVSPGSAQKEDMFLHLIEASDRSENKTAISSAKKIEEAGMIGVSFTYEGKEYKVLFSTSGPASGKISITANGSSVINENFPRAVKPQEGFAF